MRQLTTTMELVSSDDDSNPGADNSSDTTTRESGAAYLNNDVVPSKYGPGVCKFPNKTVVVNASLDLANTSLPNTRNFPPASFVSPSLPPPSDSMDYIDVSNAPSPPRASEHGDETEEATMSLSHSGTSGKRERQHSPLPYQQFRHNGHELISDLPFDPPKGPRGRQRPISPFEQARKDEYDSHSGFSFDTPGGPREPQRSPSPYRHIHHNERESLSSFSFDPHEGPRERQSVSPFEQVRDDEYDSPSGFPFDPPTGPRERQQAPSPHEQARHDEHNSSRPFPFDPPAGPQASSLICFDWYHKGHCRPKRRKGRWNCGMLHTLDVPDAQVSLPIYTIDHGPCGLKLCPLRDVESGSHWANNQTHNREHELPNNREPTFFEEGENFGGTKDDFKKQQRGIEDSRREDSIPPEDLALNRDEWMDLRRRNKREKNRQKRMAKRAGHRHPGPTPVYQSIRRRSSPVNETHHRRSSPMYETYVRRSSPVYQTHHQSSAPQSPRASPSGHRTTSDTSVIKS
ncbi:hypothetical protein N0V83_006253 [Neocucurbitaria cava]|uniref:Uncharacterized protein n=1 Tax=Neocucurbitaria cava TaxID=798079 RepID=A0A9W8Y7K4_9PLEO|nr:hypothetical protein N0V83_006253 [Neocucurbitaria cava]